MMMERNAVVVSVCTICALWTSFASAGPAASFCVGEDNYLKLRCPASKPYIKVEWIESYASCQYTGTDSCQLLGPVSITGNDLSDRCDIFNLRLHFLCHGVENECHIPNEYLMHPSQYESDYGIACHQGRPGGFQIKFSCERSNNGRQEISRLYGQCRRPLIDRSTTVPPPTTEALKTPPPTTLKTIAPTSVKHKTITIPTTASNEEESTITFFMTEASAQTTDFTIGEPTTALIASTTAGNFSVESMPPAVSTQSAITTTSILQTFTGSALQEGIVSPETIVVITSCILAVCLAVSILVLAWAIVKRKRKKSKKVKRIIKALPPLPDLDNEYAAIGGDYSNATDENVLYDVAQYRQSGAVNGPTCDKCFRNGYKICQGHGSLQDKHNNNISSSKKSLNRPHPPPKPPTNIQQAKHHYEQVQVQTVGASQAHYYSPLDQPAGHGYENRADMYHTLSPPTSRSALSIPVHAAANTGVYNQLHEAMSGRTLENTRGKPKPPTPPTPEPRGGEPGAGEGYYSIPMTVEPKIDSIYEEMPYDVPEPVRFSPLSSPDNGDKITLPVRGEINHIYEHTG